MANNITTQLVIQINGKDVENSFNGIRKEVSKLERELKKLTPGTEEFKQKAAELKEARKHFNEVKKEIDLANGKLQEAPGILSKLTKGFLDFGTIAKNVFSANLFSGIFDFFRSEASQTVDNLLKVSDAMADVQKTTGMALNEVKDLWDAFDNMDTRTSKMDRLKIAEVGGRLGVPKEEMASFVQEIDKAYVALGDSFQGGLESVVDSLGKIKGLFDETKSQSYAEAINSVGSALNELAASGTASEGNISDFALRVGALPNALKPSLDKVLGLGAAFEESGIDAQVAASGFSNFMKVAGENLNLFAQSMGISYAEAQKLFNEKPEEFFLRFAQGMKNVEGEDTTKIFDSLKIGTLEVQKAVGAAANNMDTFREAMNRAGVAMSEATSLNNEFNTKNNNAAAVWEKFKNQISDFFTERTFITLFEEVIFFIRDFVQALSSAVNVLKNYGATITFITKLLAVATVAFVSYRAAVWLTVNTTKEAIKQSILYTAIQKAQNIANQVKIFFQLAISIRSAKDAQALFNLVASANPYLALASVILTVVAAIKLFSEETDNTTKAQNALNEVRTSAAQKVAEEKMEIDRLVAIITSEVASREQQQLALKKLNDIIPDHIGLLTQQNIKTAEGKRIIDEYIKSLNKKAYVEALADKKKELIKKDIELKNEEIVPEGWFYGGIYKLNQLDKNAPFKTKMTLAEADALDKMVDKAKIDAELEKYSPVIRSTYRDRREKRAANYAQLSSVSQEEQKYIKEGIFAGAEEITHTNTAVTAPPKGKNKIPNTDKKENEIKKEIAESEKLLEKSKENQAKYDKELLDAHRKYEDEKLALMKDGYEKQKLIEETKHQRDLEDLDRQNEDKKALISDLDKDIEDLKKKINDKKTPAQAKTNYQNAIDEKKKEIEKINNIIAENNKIRETMEATHQYNLRVLQEKEIIKNFEKRRNFYNQQMEEESRLREEEIQNITTMEDAKKALSEMEFLKLTEQELKQIQTLEDAKKALRENANREALQIQLNYLLKEQTQLSQALENVTGEEAEKLKQNLDELKSKITAVNGAIQGGEENDAKKVADEKKEAKEKTDILGYSAKDWEDMYKNLDTTQGKIAAIGMVAKALGNAFSQFGELQKNLNEREMRNFTKNQDKKKKALLKQLNEGYINQEEYHKALETLEKERLNKEAEMKYKEARMDKITRIADAVSATALGVANSLKVGGPAGIALASIVGALGAIQVGIIASQPLPERETFAEGGYTGNGYGTPDHTGFRPAGIVHQDEYVTPKWMLQNPIVADVVGWMESIRTGKTNLPKGYAEGGKVDSGQQSAVGSQQLAVSGKQIADSDPQLIAVMSEVRDLLSELNKNGVDAYMVEDAENGKRIKRTIKMFENIENRNARK